MDLYVRYVGHVGQPTGYGRSAEDFCLALLRAGVKLEIHPLAPRHLELQFDQRTKDLVPFLWDREAHQHMSSPDATIVHTLPMDCDLALDQIMDRFGPHPDGFQPRLAHKTIAYTTWETPTCPEEILKGSLNAFAEVWTPSRASAASMSWDPTLGVGIHVIPHCFDEQWFTKRRMVKSMTSRGYVGSDSSRRIRFYWIGAWSSRKNPQGVIRAFAHAFGPRDDVELAMHSTGCDLTTFGAALAQTGLEQGEIPMITLSNKPKTDQEIWDMHLLGDVFVSASRGEAWNLPAFEAALVGNWVISPAELGSDDFLAHTTNLTIPTRPDIAYTTVKAQVDTNSDRVGFVSEGAKGLTSKLLWHEPDLLSLSLELDHAAKLVRSGARPHVDRDYQNEYGYAVIANKIIERIRS